MSDKEVLELAAKAAGHRTFGFDAHGNALIDPVVYTPWNPLTIGVSPLTNTIFAGRSKAVRGMAPDARQFVGPKEDVTGQVLYAAAMHLMNSDDIKVFKLPDGTELHLRADIKEAK